MTQTATRPAVPATVGVWRFELDVPTAEVDRLAGLLAPDEAARVNRFRFEVDRCRYVVGRARLRQVLGELCAVPPGALRFALNPYGKPELPGSGVHFNLSHTGGSALLAATTAGPVGVDIERLHPVRDRDSVAEHFFSAAEVAALRELPAGRRDAAFLRCWTRKEAYVKAVGGGLSMALQDFAVSLDAPPALLWATDRREIDRWSLTDLSAHCPGAVAALVVGGPPPIVSSRSVLTGTEPS